MRKFIDYYQYIKSTEWETKRALFIKKFPFCFCGKKVENVHHRHYKNIPTEPLHQLVGLCRNHHKETHLDNFGKHTINKKIMKLNIRRILNFYRNPATARAVPGKTNNCRSLNKSEAV